MDAVTTPAVGSGFASPFDAELAGMTRTGWRECWRTWLETLPRNARTPARPRAPTTTGSTSSSLASPTIARVTSRSFATHTAVASKPEFGRARPRARPASVPALGAVIDVGGVTRDRRHRGAKPCGAHCRHRQRLPYGEHDGFDLRAGEQLARHGDRGVGALRAVASDQDLHELAPRQLPGLTRTRLRSRWRTVRSCAPACRELRARRR